MVGNRRNHSGDGVALLAEGVDRNSTGRCGSERDPASPSSRRAWIEILRYTPSRPSAGVALLAEGVDRNQTSDRRVLTPEVALLAEGVDRNPVSSAKP